jgi:hypothetical protein
MPVLDESGNIANRFPLQAAAAASLLLLFALLESRPGARRPTGRLSSLAFVGLMIHLLIASLLTGDPSPIWMGLRVETWAALLFLTLFLLFVAVRPLSTRVFHRQQISEV